MAEKVVFESAIEGLFLRGLGAGVTPALKAVEPWTQVATGRLGAEGTEGKK